MHTFDTVFLVAMEYERSHIFTQLDLRPWNKQNGPYPTYATDDGVLLIETGMSKTNAAAATQWVFDHIDAKRYINVGLVGSLDSSLDYGTVLLATEVRFHDVDIRPFSPSYALGQIYATKIHTYPLAQLSLDQAIPRVRVVTGDLFVTDQSVLREIKTEFQPHCVDMEITAISHVAYQNNRLDRLSSIKIVSDKADDQATDDFYTEDRLFHAIQPVISKLLTSRS